MKECHREALQRQSSVQTHYSILLLPIRSMLKLGILEVQSRMIFLLLLLTIYLFLSISIPYLLFKLEHSISDIFGCWSSKYTNLFCRTHASVPIFILKSYLLPYLKLAMNIKAACTSISVLKQSSGNRSADMGRWLGPVKVEDAQTSLGTWKVCNMVAENVVGIHLLFTSLLRCFLEGQSKIPSCKRGRVNEWDYSEGFSFVNIQVPTCEWIFVHGQPTGLQPKRAERITSSLLPLALLLDIIYSLSLKPKTCSSLCVLSYPLLLLPVSSLDNILMISFQWSHSECYGVVLW